MRFCPLCLIIVAAGLIAPLSACDNTTSKTATTTTKTTQTPTETKKTTETTEKKVETSPH